MVVRPESYDFFESGIIVTVSLAQLAPLSHHADVSHLLGAVNMARSDQLDLFGAETKAGGFDEDAPPYLYRADPDKVRVRLHKILAEARAAQTMP
jgi:hypothetical protein